MARKLRIEFPGAIYHVMSRGDHQEAIFRDDKDRHTFLKTFTEACEMTGWIAHAYVLMGNHYHLLLETPEANLATGMKWFQGTYTQRFNSRHKIYGHLFQGRYKTLNIDDDDDYFQTVSSYIHLNPVRARLISAEPGSLSRFAWSSYPAYLKPAKKRPIWLSTERVFTSLGVNRDDSRGRRRYAAWMDARTLDCSKKPPKELEEQWKKIRRGWYLGGQSFRDRLLDWISKRTETQRDSHDGDAIRTHDEDAAAKLLQKAQRQLQISNLDLKTLPKGAPEKLVLAWWIRKQTTVNRKWIAEHLHMGHPTRITAAMRAVNDAPRRSMVANMKALLSKTKQ